MLRRIGGLGFIVLALGALVGPALVAPSSAAAASAAPARVTLISAGQSPRSPLRLVLAPGVTSASMEFSESIKQSVSGKTTNAVDTPPVQVGVESTVANVSANGDADLSYAYSGVTLADDASVSAAQREQIEAVLAPLASVTGTATITARNQILDSQVAGTEGFDPTVANLVSQLSDQIGAVAVPFPREAVGVGARWRGSSSLRASGIDVRQTYTYTLRERHANTVVLALAFTQTAARQRAELPGVPKGTKVDITKYRVTGTGTATLDLSEPVALEAQTHASGTQVFSIRAKTEHGTLTQKIAIDVKVSRPPTEPAA